MLTKVKNQISLFIEQFDIRSLQSLQSLKTMVACLMALVLITLLDLPLGQWVIITIFVVMTTQLSVGGATRKAKARLVGTIAGVGLASLTLIIFGNHFVPIVVVMLLGALVFSYIAASGGPMAYAGTLGGITLALVLLHSDPTINYGLIRFGEITLGIIIALVVSKFIFPVHASKRLPRSIAFVLNACADYYQRIFSDDEKEFGDLTDVQTIVNHLLLQQNLLDEAVEEHRKKTFNKEAHRQVIVKQRKVFRIIMMLQYFLVPEHREQASLLKAHYLQAFHGELLKAMRQLAEQAVQTDMVVTIDIEQPINNLQQQINQHLANHPEDDPAYANSFVFLVKLLGQELRALQVEIAALRSQ